MLVLGVETSCDDTCAAVVSDRGVFSSVVSSQVDVHAKYGGVVPELASRSHMKNIVPVIEEAIALAGVSIKDIKGVAVTKGPGLMGSLLVGIEAAKGIAAANAVPIVGINHIEGHLNAITIEQGVEYPHIALIVSGGHTSLYLVRGFGEYELLGRTRDDAVGEAFDKISKAMGLGYPGGARIEKFAKEGDPKAFRFPKANMGKGSLDFSFSGLKTAVARQIKGFENGEIPVSDIAASFQAVAVQALEEKAVTAALKHKVSLIVLGGGVACNETLRTSIKEKAGEHEISVAYPSKTNCTDNAAMIAAVGRRKLLDGANHGFDFSALATWPL